MGRTGGDRRLRLRLFDLGNDRCPICLTGFTEADVREGETVTLEHVPAKSVGGSPMCLTCDDCNRGVGKVEQRVVEAKREEEKGVYKMLLRTPGLPPHTVYVSEDEKGNIKTSTTFPISREEAIRLFPADLKLTRTTPTSHYKSVPWLKAAYLSVFSLLGKYGYRYAQGEAIEQVRRQIMEPSKEILRHFSFPAPPEWEYEDGVAISRNARPCWVVKMKEQLVLLPRGWDTPFYEWIVESAVDGKFELTLGGLWHPQRFGDIPAGSITLREEADFLKKNGTFGERVTLANSPDMTFACVDRTAQDITVLPVLRD